MAKRAQAPKPPEPGGTSPLASFGPATRAWFESAFPQPTPVQVLGWPRIAAGEHALLIAPTGSGKTLAAFLSCIDRLSRRHDAPKPKPGVRALYVSPLKALVYDVERNLDLPLRGIQRAAESSGEGLRAPRVAIRTGDTSTRDRQQLLRDPADILVTTPESLYLMLTSQARKVLATVETIIIDEVHALAPSKRGAHLALSLERLCAECDRDPQRIGLSATATPLDEVARFLGGDREVAIVDTSGPPNIDLKIVVPVQDMTRPGLTAPAYAPAPTQVVRSQPGMAEPQDNSIWPAVYPRLLELIRQHRTTIVFVNSRGLCERLAQRLNEEADDPDFVRAHHGSVARERREQTEEWLKTGAIKGIVATSSLELGIDMGAVDLVVLVESPGAVSRGLQRVGRAGHGVGQTSEGRVFPKHRGDLLECAVVCRRMREGVIEPLAYPRNPLDVLAQQIVAMCVDRTWSVEAIAKIVRRAANFRDLPRDALLSVLDMISGRYPSHAFADLRPRLTWHRDTDQLEARRGAKQVAIFNGGTIPDRGTYAVHLGVGGPRIGELDEEMVHESATGQNILLGATTWRIDQITRDRVIVTPAPGETGRLPFWRGDGPGRPVELGRAMGRFVAEAVARPRDEAEAWLQRDYDLDAWAARNLLDHLQDQWQHTGTLPTDRAITIERYRDEVGDWRICILTAHGSRVHAPWALAIQNRLQAHFGFEVQTVWSDDGIMLRLVEVERLPSLDILLPDPEEIEQLVVEQLAHSALFAGQFRENAARALLLPRGRANARTPLWQQRLKSQQLLAVAREFSGFPIIMETYRACLRDVFDLPALAELLGAIRTREVRVDEVETPSPSPFARSLAFDYVAAYLYDGDAPLAERKAQALNLDRKLLRELLGQEDLRELLDAGVIQELQAELQCLAPDYRASHLDDVHDLLRRLGELSIDEIEARSGPSSWDLPSPENDASSWAAGGAPRSEVREWVAELSRVRRIIELSVAGRPVYVAVEDAGLFRDALGCVPPPGVPSVFLEPVRDALPWLVSRFARTHTPFLAVHLQARWGVPLVRVHEVLAALQQSGRILDGEFTPQGREPEWCDPEVLRKIKRRTLARLRGEIAPVEGRVLGSFLPAWHGIGTKVDGPSRVEAAVAQLEGIPLPFSELEQVLLPARVPGFNARMLDELGAMGWLVWVGHGALGQSDGKVALYRRDRVAAWLDPPTPPDDLDEVRRQILAQLGSRGASFFIEVQNACAQGTRVKDVREALWDLAWRGLVTNDTFGTLRAVDRPVRPQRGVRGESLPGAVGGRWSLVADLLHGSATPTERAHACAVTLLERHGIVSRDAAALEALPGGFAPVYRVYREMEEAGTARRGYFVEGLAGAQFASPGAVDRLRAIRAAPPREAVVLSALDPALPYGWLLPWPHREGRATPRRTAGARVVLVDGTPVFYVERSGKRLITFPSADDPEVLLRAVDGLRTIATARRGKSWLIEHVDEVPARTSAFADALRRTGFTSAPRGLLLET